MLTIHLAVLVLCDTAFYTCSGFREMLHPPLLPENISRSRIQCYHYLALSIRCLVGRGDVLGQPPDLPTGLGKLGGLYRCTY